MNENRYRIEDLKLCEWLKDVLESGAAKLFMHHNSFFTFKMTPKDETRYEEIFNCATKCFGNAYTYTVLVVNNSIPDDAGKNDNPTIEEIPSYAMQFTFLFQEHLDEISSLCKKYETQDKRNRDGQCHHEDLIKKSRETLTKEYGVIWE